MENIVVVGDDRIIPFARLEDGTILLPEENYTASGDLTATGTTVGLAIDANYYLSDDPMAVMDDLSVADLADGLFIPDMAIGRLVESHEEIVTTIATFISQDGGLDLTLLDPDTGHQVIVTGYDFMIDVGTVMRERWKSFLGCEWQGADPLWCDDDGAFAPVDGSLISADWGLPGPTYGPSDRADELLLHLEGNHDGGGVYGLINLNGHANHYQTGVPGTNLNTVSWIIAQSGKLS